MVRTGISKHTPWFYDDLEKKGLLPENTRVRKVVGGYEVLIASALDSPQESERDLQEKEWTVQEEGPLKGKQVYLTFGDYSKEMKTIADNLEKAASYAANRVKLNRSSRSSANPLSQQDVGFDYSIKSSQMHSSRVGPQQLDVWRIKGSRQPRAHAHYQR